MVISASQSRDSSTETTERRFALGVGLTNECNLACTFCYRDPTRLDRLSLAQVRAVMKSLPVRSVNLGTGENGMHPDFAELVSYLRSEPIKLTITSNGYSIDALDDAQLTAFHDIEFSLDYPTEAEQDRQRGPGNWSLINKQAARCRDLGVSVTFIAVMMRSNFDRLADIAEIVKAYDAPLRINVYQSVRSEAFALTYDEYWRGFEALFARDGGSAGTPRRLRGRNGTGDAACDGAAVRLLAGRRRAARSFARPWSRHHEYRSICSGARGAVRLQGLQLCRDLRRRMRWAASPAARP
jgi:MoaA/NifB/PqqE/SkfB family radical SAM enzyme